MGYGKIVRVTNLGMSTDFSNNSFDIKPTPKSILLPVRWSPPEVYNLAYSMYNVHYINMYVVLMYPTQHTLYKLTHNYYEKY